ncbi:MAG: pyridoxamine 5'-phosphate oxidase family protein [Candidatus Saccharibacteria bacterium]|nr:pyridoxamine 5'-phosphate oxidase family protein [Candidatus Saccharibacteria bacterium]
MSDAKHRERIRQELKEAGATKYGLTKRSAKELPRFIHEDEHIGGVIYGQTNQGSAMMVATDRRILFIDKKPLFLTADELTYDIVSGFRSNNTGMIITTATLHTRMGDYTFRYVNQKALNKFQSFIEKRRIELLGDTSNAQRQSTMDKPPEAPPREKRKHNVIGEEDIEFLGKNDVGVLSTIDREGTVHGAVVSYVVEPNGAIYVLTKSDTTKARNIRTNGQVAFTVFDKYELTTMQINGLASVETDQDTKNNIFHKINRPRETSIGSSLAPVARLNAGSFVVMRIDIMEASLRKYVERNS